MVILQSREYVGNVDINTIEWREGEKMRIGIGAREDSFTDHNSTLAFTPCSGSLEGL